MTFWYLYANEIMGPPSDGATLYSVTQNIEILYSLYLETY